jgi:uncharacterized GH25 family protein
MALPFRRMAKRERTGKANYKMKRRFSIAVLGCVVVVLTATAHDLFIKLDTYFLKPNSTSALRLMNGTFVKSEGIVRRERMRDATIISPAGAIHPDSADWRDDGETTVLNLKTGEPGTYVVGISTKPNMIDLKAKDFNSYLAEDGIPDVLALRTKNGEMGKDVRERYSKHVRAIIQVGEKRSDEFKTAMGYPVEIIPQQNPYSVKVGSTISVLCTMDGKPLKNQLVLAGYESNGRLSREDSIRTNKDGIAKFQIRSRGRWYIKMIHMEALTEPDVQYESKWATLTFEIR